MKNHVSTLGLVLFGIYLLLYLGFVLLTAFWPDSMQFKVYGEVNLAVFYGFGLILVAFVLAIIYGIFGKTDEKPADAESIGGDGEEGP